MERGPERERQSKKGRDDKRTQLLKLSMLNFAKTDAELRPACALLILTTYTRIKKHLLTNWHAWINHRAILKRQDEFSFMTNLAISLKWQTTAEWKRPPALSLSQALSEAPSKQQKRSLFLFRVFFFLFPPAGQFPFTKMIYILFSCIKGDCQILDYSVCGISAVEPSKGITLQTQTHIYKI